MASHQQIRTIASQAGTKLTRPAVDWDVCADGEGEAEIMVQRFIRMADGGSGPFSQSADACIPNLPAALPH